MRLLLAPGAGTAYSAALPGTSSGAGSLRKQLVSTPEFREPVCLEQQEHIPQDAAVGRRATKVNTDSWQGQDSACRTLSRVSYCEDFGWRFGRRPLSLLLIGLLDSP